MCTAENVCITAGEHAGMPTAKSDGERKKAKKYAGAIYDYAELISTDQEVGETVRCRSPRERERRCQNA